MNSIPTTEDRIWAVISHLSALAFGMGIALPVVGWADQRRKSNYASFQHLQALGYQTLGFTVWALSSLAIIVVAAIILLALLGPGDGNGQNASEALRPWMFIIFLMLFGFFVVYFALPIIAAVACGLGRDFRYPLMGDRLARYVGYDPAQSSEERIWLNEEHEIRWVAAMGHFSILILLWGMLAPLTAWMLHGRLSFFLKCQSIQAIAYQAATTILYFVALFFYFIGFGLLIAGMGAFGTLALDSPLGILGLIVLAVSFSISFVLILLIPLLHILGQWAGYRVLKGDDYHYPFVGQWVTKWISINSTMEEKSI